MFAEIEEKFGDNLPMASLFQAPTVGELASILGQTEWSAPWSSVVPIQAKGSKHPIFFVHGPSGQVLNYRNLALHLGEDQPCYGIQAQGLNGKQTPHLRIEDMAAHYVKEIRTHYPYGPYYLGGFCFGGQVAFEMARQLQEQGQKVSFLGLFDADVRHYSELSRMTTLTSSRTLVRKFNWHLRNLVLLERGEKLTYLLTRVKNFKTHVLMRFWKIIRQIFTYTGRPLPRWFQLRDLRLIHYQAGRDYVPTSYPGRVTIFLSEDAPAIPSEDPRLGWTKLAAGGSEVHLFPGSHDTMLNESHIRVVAEKLKLCVEKAQATELYTETSHE
jgi:thioesterase domain-containing protein